MMRQGERLVVERHQGPSSESFHRLLPFGDGCTHGKPRGAEPRWRRCLLRPRIESRRASQVSAPRAAQNPLGIVLKSVSTGCSCINVVHMFAGLPSRLPLAAKSRSPERVMPARTSRADCGGLVRPQTRHATVVRCSPHKFVARWDPVALDRNIPACGARRGCR
jgi:hypothetical protein